MRLALLADIHGNPIALDAVLADIQAQGGVDGYGFIGDYAALGYDPVTPLERIVALPDAVWVRGNTDRYTASDALPPPTVEHAQADPALIPNLVEVARSFAWTRGYVTASGWYDWLADLPLEHRLMLPDGTRVLLVHAAPGLDDGPGVTLATSTDDLRAMVTGCEADLVVVGHTHWPQDHRIDGVRLINTGSVSNPWNADPRASYVLLDADASGYQITFRRVAYDVAAVITHLRVSRHPALDFILGFFEGRYDREWIPKGT
jgi:putative phosphoesterase